MLSGVVHRFVITGCPAAAARETVKDTTRHDYGYNATLGSEIQYKGHTAHSRNLINTYIYIMCTTCSSYLARNETISTQPFRINNTKSGHYEYKLKTKNYPYYEMYVGSAETLIR